MAMNHAILILLSRDLRAGEPPFVADVFIAHFVRRATAAKLRELACFAAK